MATPPSLFDVFQPRKNHSKSRNGCIRCKARKVKCDERTPQCLRCEQRQVDCEYLPPHLKKNAPKSCSRVPEEARSPHQAEHITRRDSTHRTSFTHHTASLSPSYSDPSSDLLNYVSPSQVDSVASPGLNLSDLELMRHYLEHTSKILAEHCNDEDKAYAWTDVMPELALRSPCVAHSLLALAALCFCHDRLQEERTTEDESRRLSSSQLGLGISTRNLSKSSHHYYVLAEMHHGESLSSTREELNMDSDSAKTSDTIFATSVLLSTFYPAYLSAYHLRSRLSQTASHLDSQSRSAITTPRSTPQDSNTLEPTLIEWFILLRGASLTVRDSKNALPSPIQVLRNSNELIAVPPEWTSTSDASREFRTTMCSPIQPAAYRHPLYPVLCATGPSAFGKLEGLLTQSLSYTSDPSTHESILTCLQALHILQSATAAFTAWPSRHAYPSNRPFPSPISAPVMYDRCPHRAILSWIASVDANYIALLKQGDMMAEAVLAMFLVFLVVLEESWWLRGLGREETRRVLEGWSEKRRQWGAWQDGRKDGMGWDEAVLDVQWRKWFEWQDSMVGVLEEMGKFGS